MKRGVVAGRAEDEAIHGSAEAAKQAVFRVKGGVVELGRRFQDERVHGSAEAAGSTAWKGKAYVAEW